MPLRAVVFDAVGTLIYPDPPAAVAYATAARRIGVEIGAEEIRRRFRAAFQRQEALDRLPGGRKTSPERERLRWREIVSEVFRDGVTSGDDREALFAELWDHFARPECWRLYDDVTSCWHSLASRGLIVAIGSNFDDRLEQIAQRIALLDWATRLFISARIGWRKPAGEFFNFVARELGSEPGDILSVGDDLENDYCGPKSAGWRAVLLNRGGNCEPSADDVIGSLAELTEPI